MIPILYITRERRNLDDIQFRACRRLSEMLTKQRKSRLSGSGQHFFPFGHSHSSEESRRSVRRGLPDSVTTRAAGRLAGLSNRSNRLAVPRAIILRALKKWR